MSNTKYHHQESKRFELSACSIRYIGITSLSLLSLLTLAFIFPFVSSNSSALDQAHWSSQAVPSALSLALDAKAMEVNVTPTANGTLAEGTASLSINTQNAGYSLYLSTMDATTSLVSTNANSKEEIKSITTPTTTLSPNTWGYRVDDSHEYQPISLTPTLVTAAPAGFGTTNTQYDYHFGYNLDTTLPAGAHTNTLLFSAIASPAQVQGLLSINYMQDMTTNVCKETIGTDFSPAKDAAGSYIITPGSEPTKQLIDIRDGKEYWVAKLADGNCWMTQNLALDLNEKTLPLTPESSDVSQNWEPEAYTYTEPLKILKRDNNGTASWNMGLYVIKQPATASSCQLFPPDGTFSQCTNLQNVSGAEWKPTFDARNDQHGTEYVSYNPDAQTFDAHYLNGNWYQWNTAAAGTGTDLFNSTTTPTIDTIKDAANSICPKNWQLPVSGSNSFTEQAFPLPRSDSFFELFRSYGYSSNPQDYNIASTTSYATPFLSGEYQQLNKYPFYWANFGGYFPQVEYAYWIGTTAHLWSSTPYGNAPSGRSDNAYFGASNVANEAITASSTDPRYYFYSVRCLAK